jgi:hypothetical protein
MLHGRPPARRAHHQEFPEFALLDEREVAELRPVLEAIVRRRDEIVHRWYELYARRFGELRSLRGSDFVRLFESALERSLTRLVEGAGGEFAREHFIALQNRRYDHAVAGISREALQAIMQYSFPGNARELAGLIEHSCRFSDSAIIEIENLPPPVGQPSFAPRGTARRKPVIAMKMFEAGGPTRGGVSHGA